MLHDFNICGHHILLDKRAVSNSSNLVVVCLGHESGHWIWIWRLTYHGSIIGCKCWLIFSFLGFLLNIHSWRWGLVWNVIHTIEVLLISLRLWLLLLLLALFFTLNFIRWLLYNMLLQVFTAFHTRFKALAHSSMFFKVFKKNLWGLINKISR